MFWGFVMAMRRLVAALALGAAAAGGVVVLALPAGAGTVACGSIGFSSENYGNAWARGCSHSGDHDVRLAGDCIFLPKTAYSPWRHGDFSGVDFDTTTCAFGVNRATFTH
ncbi:hypothetical protein D5S17_18910 [Pseudonocardiaceae bacterium YIM PH 21723]|nr:hypothetical protein D5S17_18910 [Pseudonocardiaceae bacterium YIM PH 21723]